MYGNGDLTGGRDLQGQLDLTGGCDLCLSGGSWTYFLHFGQTCVGVLI